MKRTTAISCIGLLLSSCMPQGAWQPTVSPAAGFEDGIPADEFVDGCWVEWDSLLVGIASGTLLDGDGLATAALPGDQAFELAGRSGTTLAQVHLSSGPTQSGFLVQLGPPQEPVSSPYDGPCPMGDCGGNALGDPDNPVRGSASPEQRARLRDLAVSGLVAGRLSCGKGTELSFEWWLPQGNILCPITDWELLPAQSASTWLDFNFQNLFALRTGEEEEEHELLGRPWLLADLDDDGRLSTEESGSLDTTQLGLPESGSLADWIERRTDRLVSIERQDTCSWSNESGPP